MHQSLHVLLSDLPYQEGCSLLQYLMPCMHTNDVSSTAAHALTTCTQLRDALFAAVVKQGFSDHTRPAGRSSKGTIAEEGS